MDYEVERKSLERLLEQANLEWFPETAWMHENPGLSRILTTMLVYALGVEPVQWVLLDVDMKLKTEMITVYGDTNVYRVNSDRYEPPTVRVFPRSALKELEFRLSPIVHGDREFKRPSFRATYPTFVVDAPDREAAAVDPTDEELLERFVSLKADLQKA